MLTDQYNDYIQIMGRSYTLAQADVALRAAVLVVCLVNLVLNILDLTKGH